MHEEYVKKKDDGEEVIYTEPSAAFLGAVTKFLKDNSVTCSVDDSSSLSELEKRLMAKKTGRNVVQLRDISIA
jgi:hypothetical protein